MWFKNLQIYRFTERFELDAATLGEQLGQQAFVPCANQDAMRSGWVPPLGRHGSELVHATNGYLMICVKRQEKLLPAAVVNEALEDLQTEARGGLIEHHGVMTLASPLRFIQPSNENSDV